MRFPEQEVGYSIENLLNVLALTTAPAVEEVQTPYGCFLSLRGDEITLQLHRYGGHTRPELAMLLDLVRPGDTVLDVGAHIGTFAIPLAARGAVVHAFEPYASTRELLARNASANGVQVHIWPFVCADESGWFDPVLPEFENSGWVEYVTGSEIQGVVLDDWWREQGCPHVDVLKIDVEGMESEVLRGACTLVEHCLPIVHAEIWSEARQDLDRLGGWLHGLGYELFRNTGPRNAPSDRYRLGHLLSLEGGGYLFDVLAVHPAGGRLPEHADGVLHARARIWWQDQVKRHPRLGRLLAA